MNKLNIVQIPIVFDECFINEYISNRKPFVLREFDIGPCADKWSPDYLSNLLGMEEVNVHVSEFEKLDFVKKNFSYKTLLFKDLLNRASEKKHTQGNFFFSETEYYYLRSVGKDPRKDIADVQKQFPAVANDLQFPTFVPKDRIFSSVFRIASENLQVWTHYDVMDNALLQVKGHKRAVLFPPSDVPFLYLNGDKSEVLDIDEPDLDVFPKFLKATRHEVMLLPGDSLFIPAFWFHNMKYLELGVSVNVFWKELDPSLYDKKDPYGNRDLQPAQQAFSSLDRALTALSKLPQSYRQFYQLRLIDQIQKQL